MTLIYDHTAGTFRLNGTPCVVKHTRACRIAVRRGGQWHYFKWDCEGTRPTRYVRTGSTARLEHT